MGNFLKDSIAGLVSGLGDTADKIIKDFKADPNKVLEAEQALQKLKSDTQIQLTTLANAAEEIQAQELESVNATMREEGKSEHWMVWAWRPLIGFTFCLIIINNYVALPYLKKHGLEPVAIPDNVWMAILTILGVASAGRAAMQWQKAKNDQ